MRRAMVRFVSPLCCGALLFAAGCASAAAGEGARLEESPALIDRVRIVAPADGATVPLLKDGHKEFLDSDRAAEVFASAANLRAAYNELRRMFGNAEGRACYNRVKAILDEFN